MANLCHTVTCYKGTKENILKIHTDMVNLVLPRIQHGAGYHAKYSEYAGYDENNLALLLMRTWYPDVVTFDSLTFQNRMKRMFGLDTDISSNNIHIRSFVESVGDIVYNEDGSAQFKCVSLDSWSPALAPMAIISKEYNVEVYYLSEELGFGMYITNDLEGNFFKEKYIVAILDDPKVDELELPEIYYAVTKEEIYKQYRVSNEEELRSTYNVHCLIELGYEALPAIKHEEVPNV